MQTPVILAWAAAISLAAAAVGAPILAQPSPAPHTPEDEGKRVFMRANCMGCHKWHGGGGGGYGGDALSLRKTELSREQIIETVSCGRPGTGMPYFRRDAYGALSCYGLNREDLGKQAPVEGPVFLRPPEVEAVADYVLALIKGRGEPSYADCTAFFGEGSRMCRIYQPP